MVVSAFTLLPQPQKMESLLYSHPSIQQWKNENEIQTSFFLFIQQYWLLLAEYFYVNSTFKATKILLVMFMR